MHVAHIGFHLDAQRRDPERLLEAWPTLVDIAEAVERAGLRVSVVQACARDAKVTRNAVSYHFFAADSNAPPKALAAGAGSLIRQLDPDVLHVNGLCFPTEVSALADLSPDMPILLQDHGTRVPRIWRRRGWRRGFDAAAGVAFCSRDQCRPFVAAGLIGRRTVIYEVPESSSHFTPGDQALARVRTQLTGDPCLLWVGRLVQLKDPLTVLAGVSVAARRLPGLQLWCCFADAPLVERVKCRVDEDPLLRDRVHLLGRVPHETIEQLMRAADIFVAGSHLEGSGYALIEALACGLAPVVTDIPSHRALTGNGRLGRLWPVADAQGLAEALLDVASRPRAAVRAETRAFFDAKLSFNSVGQTLAAVYRQVAREPARNSGAPAAYSRLV